MPVLAFYIDAPLQSWGSASRYQHRETQAYPTKSALIGLIAAALGIDKNSHAEAAELQAITRLLLTVVRLDKPSNKPSRFTDFHTVGGGYDKKALSWERMSIPQKASGAPFGTVITHRSYLSDACFVALFEGDADVLVRVRSALLNPVWGVWFGRKTCLPASPLTPTLGADRQQALNALLEALPDHQVAPLEQLPYQEEVDTVTEADGSYYQSDQPIAFGQHHGPVPVAYHARNIFQHRPSKG